MFTVRVRAKHAKTLTKTLSCVAIVYLLLSLLLRLRVSQCLANAVFRQCWLDSIRIVKYLVPVIFTQLDTSVSNSSTVQVKKKSPLRGPDIFHFFHKRLRIFNRFFTHLLHVPIYARLQIFIQLSPIMRCHIERDYRIHIICSKCPPSAKTHALTRSRMSLLALLIVVCGKSL